MLLVRVAMRYGCIIRKHPQGLGDRMRRFDQWTQTWQDPNITSYYSYFHNGEVPQFEVLVPDSESSKNDLAQCEAKYRPALSRMVNSLDLFENEFWNDRFLSVDDPKELTLRKFLRDCCKGETRQDVHRFFLWLCTATVLFAVGFYRGVFKADFRSQVVSLEPDESYYRYNPNVLQAEVEAFIGKVGTLNRHSQEELERARARALRRQSDSK